MFKSFISFTFPIFLLFACNHTEKANSEAIFSIKFVDKIVIDNNELVDSTRIGGLSSIDYLGDNKYIAISDDRSEFSPARIYEMEIDIDSSSILGYSFNKTIFLKNRDNIFFKENELDPESIRYRASTNTYFYTSEGGRTDDWVNPFIWEINEEGELISEVTVPEIFNFNEQKGLRENGGFESLTFENDSIIWYANELPLKEDSEVPGFEDDNYLIRLVRHDIKNDNVLNHFVYNISSLNEKPIPDDGFYINSVPEILYIDKSKLWVLERSYTTGVGNFIKVFEIDTRNASDVKGINALLGRDISTVAKKLILNFSDFNIKLDNIEGMTIGPNLPDGSKSLLFISDDNFSKTQETQLWLFSVNAL